MIEGQQPLPLEFGNNTGIVIPVPQLTEKQRREYRSFPEDWAEEFDGEEESMRSGGF